MATINRNSPLNSYAEKSQQIRKIAQKHTRAEQGQKVDLTKRAEKLSNPYLSGLTVRINALLSKAGNAPTWVAPAAYTTLCVAGIAATAFLAYQSGIFSSGGGTYGGGGAYSGGAYDGGSLVPTGAPNVVPTGAPNVVPTAGPTSKSQEPTNTGPTAGPTSKSQEPTNTGPTAGPTSKPKAETANAGQTTTTTSKPKAETANAGQTTTTTSKPKAETANAGQTTTTTSKPKAETANAGQTTTTTSKPKAETANAGQTTTTTSKSQEKPTNAGQPAAPTPKVEQPKNAEPATRQTFENSQWDRLLADEDARWDAIGKTRGGTQISAELSPEEQLRQDKIAIGNQLLERFGFDPANGADCPAYDFKGNVTFDQYLQDRIGKNCRKILSSEDLNRLAKALNIPPADVDQARNIIYHGIVDSINKLKGKFGDNCLLEAAHSSRVRNNALNHTRSLIPGWLVYLLEGRDAGQYGGSRDDFAYFVGHYASENKEEICQKIVKASMTPNKVWDTVAKGYGTMTSVLWIPPKNADVQRMVSWLDGNTTVKSLALPSETFERTRWSAPVTGLLVGGTALKLLGSAHPFVVAGITVTSLAVPAAVDKFTGFKIEDTKLGQRVSAQPGAAVIGVAVPLGMIALAYFGLCRR